MIYTIESGVPFSDALADFLLKKYEKAPFELAQTLIILPTVRAIRSLKEAFTRQSKKKSFLLPRITSLYETNAFDKTIEKTPLSPMQHLFLLAKLVGARQKGMTSLQILSLARSLSDFLNEFYQYEIDFDVLETLAPEQFAEHWQQTLNFLDIVKTYWPEILKEKNRPDPQAYKIKVLRSLLQEWQETPPSFPVVMAGFTGGLPVVRDLIAFCSNFDKGLVVLDGLMTSLDEEYWKAIEPTHPQYDLKLLLNNLRLKPDQIRPLPVSSEFQCSPELEQRRRLIYEAMRPTETLQAWATFQSEKTECPVSDALKDVELYTYETMEKEALGIAIRLREVLNTTDKTAALVTTDTNLSKRVIAQMKRWGILLDDSAGTPFNRLPVGTFLTLLAKAASNQSSYGALLALLKHPLATDKMGLTDFRQKVHHWEKEKRKNAKETADFSLNSSAELESFFNLFKEEKQPFYLLLQKHLQAAEALAQSKDKTGSERLWGGEYGKSVSVFLTQLEQDGKLLGDIPTAEYPALFESLIGELSLRPKYGMHPQLDILGPIEARLQNPDIMIIGEVNEDIWPKETPVNPWMSRPMRVMCALPSLEEKTGLLAHDFVHSFMTKKVIMTRAVKKAGTQTLPSRWLLRLQTVLKAGGFSWQEKTDDLLSFMDKADSYVPWPKPAPTPPVESRPTSFSATGIERLKKDPYAIYAEHILHLKKLEELDTPAGYREYGNAVHRAVQIFTSLPEKEQTLDRLLALGQQEMEKEHFDSFFKTFFANRFNKTAAWFVQQQEQRLPFIQKTLSEIKGTIEIKNDSGQVWNLNARADRIDILNTPKNAVLLIDYKTGYVPSIDEVYYGYAPQLTLEALIAQQGGFEELQSLPRPLTLQNPEYWKLSNKETGGKITQSVANSKKQYKFDEVMDLTLKGLKNLMQWYSYEDTPYEVRPNPKYVPSYSDYEALERLGEWGALQEEENNDS
jgi:ATP-dependent helicase/nuclease subunit B